MIADATPAAKLLPSAMWSSTPFLLSKVGMEARKRVCDALGEEGVHIREYAVLACVDEFGPLTQRDVAEHLHFDASDMVTLVDVLESQNLVERRRNEADRRRYDLRITTKGHHAMARYAKAAERKAEEFLQPLDDDERSTLHELLLRLFASYDDRIPRP